MENNIYYYSLSDMDGNVFYVGMTCNPNQRLYFHLMGAKRSTYENRGKCEKIRSLDYKIKMNILEKTIMYRNVNPEIAEFRWMQHFMSLGVKLTNIRTCRSDYKKIRNGIKTANYPLNF